MLNNLEKWLINTFSDFGKEVFPLKMTTIKGSKKFWLLQLVFFLFDRISKFFRRSFLFLFLFFYF